MTPSRQLLLIRKRKKIQLQLLVTIIVVLNVFMLILIVWCMMGDAIHKIQRVKETKRDKKRRRLNNLNALIIESDVACRSELRMNRDTFYVLCEMVRDIGGLTGSRNMSLEEIVAMFLYTLSHKFKNRTVGNYFIRSGETVSRNFHRCLLAILKLHKHLLKKPTPIAEDCEDSRWKYFKVMSNLFIILS